MSGPINFLRECNEISRRIFNYLAMKHRRWGNGRSSRASIFSKALTDLLLA